VSEPPADLVELWLIRHGETAWSRARRHTGRTDVPLTEAGRQQAVALRPLLAAQAWDLVLCSPLARARETAELGLPGRSLVFDEDLVERDYGPAEGRTSAEYRRTDPTWDSWRTPIAGAETIDDVGARADRVIARLAGAVDSLAVEAADGRGVDGGDGRAGEAAVGRAGEADGGTAGSSGTAARSGAAAPGTPAAPAAPVAPGASGAPVPTADRRVLIVAHGHLLRVLAARWIEQPAVVGSRLVLDVAAASVLGYEHGRRVIVRWNVRG
jgi:broad specificity phosphatase PhoE